MAFRESKKELIVEGADYLIDGWACSTGCRVREALASPSHPMFVDTDYLYFLRELDGYVNAKNGEEEEEDVNVDPQYKLWLDGSFSFRNAYVLEVPDGEGKVIRVMYEYAEAEEGDWLLGRKRKVPGSRVQGGSLGSDGQSEFNSKDSKRRKEDGLRTGSVGSRNLLREQKRNRNPSPRLNVNTPSKRGMGPGRHDDVYSMFLDSLKVEGEKIVFVYGDGVQVRYEEDDNAKSLSESRTQPLEADTATSSGARTEVDCFWKDDPEDDHLTFRERVMNRLGRPYDQNELMRLMELAKLRKPITYYRETRAGNMRPYTVPGELGKSYLDHHPELQKLMKKVDFDNYKVLNLLRGFFFWLRHLTNDGAFNPWTDKACKAWMLSSGNGGPS